MCTSSCAIKCAIEHKVARAFVYDMRNYTRKTWWGPYTPTKNISWQHVDAISQIVLHNLKEHHAEEELSALPPLGYKNMRRFSAKDYSKRDENDWAGEVILAMSALNARLLMCNVDKTAVEGVWTRLVSAVLVSDSYDGIDILRACLDIIHGLQVSGRDLRGQGASRRGSERERERIGFPRVSPVFRI